MTTTAEDRSRRKQIIAGASVAGLGGLGLYATSGDRPARFANHLNSKLDAALRAQMGGQPDEIGGTTADKLDRLHRRAKGTPEGEAALRKLTELREKQGRTLKGKAKTMISKITSKISRKKVPFGGHLLSARAQLISIIEFKPVDLGYTHGDMDYGPCASAASAQKKHFPSLYIHDRANDIDLPLSGKAVITYKLRSKTTRQNEEGNKRHSADIEIQTIDPIEEEEKPAKEGEKAKVRTLSARDRLNAIIHFADPRPRNPLGMFTDANDQSIDPNSIGTVYKTRRTIGENLVGGAVAGVGAAASGGALKALFSKLKKTPVLR